MAATSELIARSLSRRTHGPLLQAAIAMAAPGGPMARDVFVAPVGRSYMEIRAMRRARDR